jgi:hypothetical protein
MVSQAGGVPAVEQQAEHALLGGDSDVHVCCCRPNVALCGKDLSGRAVRSAILPPAVGLARAARPSVSEPGKLILLLVLCVIAIALFTGNKS